MKSIVFAVVSLTLGATSVFSEDAQKPSKDPSAVFQKRDTDKNGSLSKQEFTANAKNMPAAEAKFDKKDTNKDGALSLEEFTGKPKAEQE